MKYFVTEGAGFIGYNLIHRLLSQGHDLTANDNFSKGMSDCLKKIR